MRAASAAQLPCHATCSELVLQRPVQAVAVRFDVAHLQRQRLQARTKPGQHARRGASTARTRARAESFSISAFSSMTRKLSPTVLFSSRMRCSRSAWQ